MEKKPNVYSLQKGIQKGVLYAAKLIVAFCLSHGVTLAGRFNGIFIDFTDEVVIAGILNSIIIVAANAVKTKWPEKFGWL